MTDTTKDLVQRLKTHVRLKDASPGFHLTDEDMAEIIDLLTASTPDLTWFWEIVDRDGPIPANVPSDEKAVLRWLVSKATASTPAKKDAGEYVMVPREPTAAMLEALLVFPDMGPNGHIIRYSVDKMPDAYARMLAARPLPAQADGDVTERAKKFLLDAKGTQIDNVPQDALLGQAIEIIAGLLATPAPVASSDQREAFDSMCKYALCLLGILKKRFPSEKIPSDIDALFQDAMAKARSLPLPAADRDGWQDISTAPKNQIILMWAQTHELTPGKMNWKMATGCIRPYSNDPDKVEWEGRTLKSYDWKPTHWRPLPAPPARGQVKEGTR